MRGRIGEVVSALLACLLMIAAVGTPSTARAEDAVQDVAIVLTAVNPAVWAGSGNLTISGTVTNTSDRPIRRLQVHLWRSADLLTTPDQLDRALASAPEDPVGERLLDATTGQVVSIPDAQDPTLRPGEKATFRVTAPVQGPNSLGFTRTDAVALVGVHVRGAPDGLTNRTVGRARTVLPLLGGTAPRYGEVVLLSSAPSLIGAGLFSDDHLAAELTGRLSVLLGRAGLPGRTVVLDPALYEAVTAMAQGYQVQSGPGVRVNGTGTPAAARWLATLGPLLSTGRVYQGVYATPDVGLAAAIGDPALVNDVRMAARGLDTSRLPLAVVPRSGLADQRLIDYLAPNGVRLLVTGSTREPGVFTGPPVVAGVSPAVLAGPGPGSSSRAQQYGTLAATDLLADRAGRPRVHLVTEPADIDRLAPLQRFQVVPVADLAAAGVPKPEWAAIPTPVPDRVWLAEITRVRALFRLWGEMSSDYTLVGSPNKLGSASWSTRWADSARATAWTTRAAAALSQVFATSPVGVQASGSFVMGSATAQVPITVTNTVGNAVTVKVRFRSENPQRITIADTGAITLGPFESDTVVVTPRASGNAVVAFHVQVVTVEGTPLSETARFTVQATSMGDVAWIIIIASGVVLLGATAWRIKAVQASRSKEAA